MKDLIGEEGRFSRQKEKHVQGEGESSVRGMGRRSSMTKEVSRAQIMWGLTDHL